MSRVLIVDDHEENLHLLDTILRSNGYAVMQAGNGAEALKAARGEPPDLVISDIFMPVMDGFALCREWNRDERLRQIPFVFYTATYTDSRDEELGLSLGAARFLIKGMEPEAFVAALRQVIQEHGTGQLAAPRPAAEEETVYYRLYNEALVRKLEHKMFALEATKQTLEQDIIDRKRVELALRQSEEQFRAMFEVASIGMAQADVRTGQWLRVNDRMCAITGYAAEEMLRMRVPEITHPEDRDVDWKAFERVVRGEAPDYRMEKRYVRKDGTLIWVNVNMTVIRGADGRPLRTMATIEDITDRKQAEEALATRTRQLEVVREVAAEIGREMHLGKVLNLITWRAKELVAGLSATVFLWDEAGQFLVPGAWHGYGEWRGEVRLRLGEGVAGSVAERGERLVLEDYPASPYALPSIMAQTDASAVLAEPLLYRNQVVGVIVVDRAKGERRFSTEDVAVLALFANHAAIAIENARLYEASQRHASELEARVQERTQQLAATNERLQAASQHKSEFLANMSHELRTPLNSILGFAQLLLEQTAAVLSEKQTRYLTHVHNSGQHLLQLINDILDLSKVEAGKFVLQPERLPVAETLEDILVIARGLANKKGQTITTAIAPDLPPLHADPVRFKQILFNVLSNAVKFTPNGGEITVRAWRVPRIADVRLQIADCPDKSEIANLQSEIGDFLGIAVTDTGIGIKAGDLPRLFQEFVQLEGIKSQEGTGLGLALTKRLVTLHGGWIWVTSPGEGKGSTVTVVLPVGGRSPDTLPR